MNRTARLIQNTEIGKHEDVFTKATFTNILNELNLGEPRKTYKMLDDVFNT